MRLILIQLFFFIVIQPCRAFITDNPSVIVKISSTDCASCMLGLEELNDLNHKIDLNFVLRNDDQTNTLTNIVSKIVKRPYQVTLSDSLYRTLQLSRSSFYLYINGSQQDFGHLTAFDAVHIKLLSTPFLWKDVDTLARVNSGFNDLQLVTDEDLIIHNLGLNSIIYYNHLNHQSYTWRGVDLGRLDIYKALHHGDTTSFWKNVTRHEEVLSKYNMYDLKFESVTRLDSNLFVFATLHNMNEMDVGGELKYVISPQLIVCNISLSNPKDIEYIRIDDLPKSKQKRYSIDNTQQIVPLDATEWLVPIYSETFGRKNRIFAKYRRDEGAFKYHSLMEFELPMSFVEDGLVYEGNYYSVQNGLLVYIATGDFIDIETGDQRNFNLGKTVLSKANNEYQKVFDWRIEGYKVSGKGVYLYYKESNVRKVALYDTTEKEPALVLELPINFTNLEVSSNFSFSENGDFYFVSKEGYLLKV